LSTKDEIVNRLKAAVIGTGQISKEHLAYLQQSEYAHLVGVCDLSAAAARYAAKQFQADAAYTNYQEMLEYTRPDIVHILTPAHTHERIATDCLKAGAHVFCEKPITPTYNEFKELWAIAQQHQRHLLEDHNYRFNRPVLELERLVASGVLGELRDIEVFIAQDLPNSRFADANLPNPLQKLPAGVIHDYITHLSYLTLRFIPDFDSVRAAWRNYSGNPSFKYDNLDAVVIHNDVHARIRFCGTARPDTFTILIRGSEGYASTNLFQPHLRCVVPRAGGKVLSPIINHFVNGYDFMTASAKNFRNKVMQRTVYEGMHRLLDQTYQAVKTNAPLPISFEDMERTNRLIDALVSEANWI
jgi:predicted dehydrogenase